MKPTQVSTEKLFAQYGDEQARDFLKTFQQCMGMLNYVHCRSHEMAKAGTIKELRPDFAEALAMDFSQAILTFQGACEKYIETTFKHIFEQDEKEAKKLQ